MNCPVCETFRWSTYEPLNPLREADETGPACLTCENKRIERRAALKWLGVRVALAAFALALFIGATVTL